MLPLLTLLQRKVPRFLPLIYFPSSNLLSALYFSWSSVPCVFPALKVYSCKLQPTLFNNLYLVPCIQILYLYTSMWLLGRFESDLFGKKPSTANTLSYLRILPMLGNLCRTCNPLNHLHAQIFPIHIFQENYAYACAVIHQYKIIIQHILLACCLWNFDILSMYV